MSTVSRYTKKVQVLLTEEQYQYLLQIAEKEHKKIGALIREVVERTYLADRQREKTRRAATELLKLAEQAGVEAPKDYHEWEKEYARLKWSGHGSDQ